LNIAGARTIPAVSNAGNLFPASGNHQIFHDDNHSAFPLKQSNEAIKKKLNSELIFSISINTGRYVK
jgi:hypothetical protein